VPLHGRHAQPELCEEVRRIAPLQQPHHADAVASHLDAHNRGLWKRAPWPPLQHSTNESVATGRFRKCHEASDSDTCGSWRLPILRTQKSNAKDSELDVQLMIRFRMVGFLFFQRLLRGLSLSALYVAFTVQSPEEFFIQYSTRANEIRRYFFGGITLRLTGSLYATDTSLKGRNMGKSEILVLVFDSVLITTRLCSHVDVRISNMEMQNSVAHDFTCFSVPRSILRIAEFCVTAWNSLKKPVVYFLFSMGCNVQR